VKGVWRAVRLSDHSGCAPAWLRCEASYFPQRHNARCGGRYHHACPPGGKVKTRILFSAQRTPCRLVTTHTADHHLGLRAPLRTMTTITRPAKINSRITLVMTGISEPTGDPVRAILQCRLWGGFTRDQCRSSLARKRSQPVLAVYLKRPFAAASVYHVRGQSQHQCAHAVFPNRS
jgi:hypothetical protein